MDSSEFARSGLGRESSHLRTPRSGSAATPSATGPAERIGGAAGWHAPALLLVLFVLFPLVVVDSVWSADIGARLYQAKALLATGQWEVPHPLPRADPTGVHFPLHLSSATEDNFRYIPFAKHPALVWLTAALQRIGGGLGDRGLSAVVAVQTLSTFAAAVGTSRLTARTRPGLAVPALWFTGLITPLFFDAYLGYAHSLAAALFIWAAVLTLQFVDPLPIGTSSDGSRLVLAAMLVAMACLIRTEATLLGLAAAGGLLIAGWSTTQRRRWAFAAAAYVLTTASATTTNWLLRPDTIGLANPDHAVDPWGGIAGRFEGVQRTLLLPGRNPTDVLVLVSAALVIAAGFLVGRRRREQPIAEAMLALATLAAVARITTGEPLLVFGLFMACPLLIVGLVRGFGASWSSSDSRFCLITFGLFFGAVATTQYRFGGVAEWGGRYFAAGIPFAVVVAVRGFHAALAGLLPRRVIRLVALGVAPALIINIGGVVSLRDSRIVTASMVDEIAEAMATVRFRGGAGGGESIVLNVAPEEDDRPVVVTTVPAVGRLAWTEVDNGRWLLVDDEELAATTGRLSELGVRRFVLVTFDPDAELAEIEQFYRPDPSEPTPNIPGEVLVVSAVEGSAAGT